MPSPKSAKGEHQGVRLQRKGSSLRRRGRSGGGSGDPAAWAAAAEGGPLLVDQVRGRVMGAHWIAAAHHPACVEMRLPEQRASCTGCPAAQHPTCRRRRVPGSAPAASATIEAAAPPPIAAPPQLQLLFDATAPAA